MVGEVHRLRGSRLAQAVLLVGRLCLHVTCFARCKPCPYPNPGHLHSVGCPLAHAPGQIKLQVAPYLALSLTGYETLKAFGAYLEERKPLQKLLGN